jgi:chromosomal replication initiation ATPase DnaA
LWDIPDEDPTCEWALAKQKIRDGIGQVPFSNWFDRTRQIERRKEHIAIAVPDHVTRLFIEEEYGTVMRAALAEQGIERIELAAALADLKTHQRGEVVNEWA